MVRRLMLVGSALALLVTGACTSENDPAGAGAAAPTLPGLCGRIGEARLLKLVPGMTLHEVEPSVLPTAKGSTPQERLAVCDVRTPPKSESGAVDRSLRVVLEGAIDVDKDCADMRQSGDTANNFMPTDELAGVGDRACGYVRDQGWQVMITVLAGRGDNDVSVVYSAPPEDFTATRTAVVDFTRAVLGSL